MNEERSADRDLSEPERIAEELACRLDVPFTVAGFLFVLVVLADSSTPSSSPWTSVWTLAGWVLWSLFVLEFLLRMVIARSTVTFLRRNWWQVIFLVVPFLRFLRAFSRTARVARAVSSSVRSTRTAARALASRIAWLATVTVGVILAASQLLYDFGPHDSYGRAMHDATLAAVAGEPIGADRSTVSDVVEVVLVLYATVFFAALAGSIGAFFLGDRPPREQR